MGTHEQHGGWGRGHNYVRKGGLIEEFEHAFREAMELAVAGLRPHQTSALGVDAASTCSGAEAVPGYNDRFHEALKLNGKKVQQVDGDGYCLFHAVAVGLGRSGEGMDVFNEVLAALVTRKEELIEGRIW